MKISIGLFILVTLLIAVCGCTAPQATPNATATIPATPAPTTEVPTTVATPLPTTAPATVATTAAPVVTTKATPVPTPQTTTTVSTKITIIHIRNNTFVPSELTVLPGTGITWVNDDAVTHVVKATGDAAGKFKSSDLINGGTFGYTFGETLGTYEFADPNYPDMKGKIIVKLGQTLWKETETPRSMGT